MCNIEVLPEDETGGAVVLGEEAHIVARETDGARGVSPLTEDQRDEYSNLILLCPTDHTRIDKKPSGPAEYPIERLLQIKQDHEAKVKSALGYDAETQANEEKWARLIDQFAARIDWDDWPRFTSNLVDAGFTPSITEDDFERLKALDQWLLTRVWPDGHEKLRSLLEGIREVINDLIMFLSRNCAPRPQDSAILRLERQYQKIGWDPARYSMLLAKYSFDSDLIFDLILELTRFGNAICDQVRAEIDGHFRFEEGILLVMYGPLADFEYRYLRPEFRPEDFKGRDHPYPGLGAFKEERFTRDVCVSQRDEEREEATEVRKMSDD
jgi:hypothetical protein